MKTKKNMNYANSPLNGWAFGNVSEEKNTNDNSNNNDENNKNKIKEKDICNDDENKFRDVWSIIKILLHKLKT